ncbi:MAG: hypothetical protein R6V45_12600 [Oceanipulchritudo sp.]
MVLITLFLSPLPLVADGWEPSPDVIRHWQEEVRPGFIYTEEAVPDYSLPPLLNAVDGTPISSREDWLENRNALLDLFREHVYGLRPGPPEAMKVTRLETDPEAMEGAATLKRIRLACLHDGKRFSFNVVLFIPNAREGPVPVFLLLNNRDPELTDPSRRHKSPFWPAEAVIGRGYGIAALQNEDVAPDDPEAFREEALALFHDTGDPRSPSGPGAIAAWSWGASRVMDYFERDPGVKASQVALIGHSRGGKTALWAGAEDERFSLVVSNNSGCGGAALNRRQYGETLTWINSVFPHWFSLNFHQFGGDTLHRLPVDQHQLLALVAPRALYIASADEDLWADPRGEFLSLAHASEVYALWGNEVIEPDSMPSLDDPLRTARQAYHIRPGGHDLTAGDWDRFMDFAERVFQAP